MKLEFSRQIFEKYSTNFMKICPVGVELLHGQTDLNLITVQQDATYSVYYISVGRSTCFGC